MAALDEFLDLFSDAFRNEQFVRLTLSKPRPASAELKNVYVKPVSLKGEIQQSFTYRYKTRDEVKNLPPQEAYAKIEELLGEQYLNAVLMTSEGNFELRTSKKGKATLIRQKGGKAKKEVAHDRQKNRLIDSNIPFLTHLGVSDTSGKVIPKMADKYRQINKFLEIMEGLINDIDQKKQPIHIVDMGSGKGYLTFALYHYLTFTKQWEVKVTGVELRPELVKQCNEVADKCDYKALQFVSQRIEEFDNQGIDLLIALHACDTATDDAIAKGILAKAELIVCAPCCHKQIRQQLKGKPQSNPILKHGIFKERQYEMVTDAIRALILEREGYDSKIFEFVSNEHTRKNVMLVGVNKHRPKKEADAQLQSIKDEFGIEFQQLEKLL